MDWKRERDGLAVVVGIVIVIGIVAAGGSVVRFASTLLATFLGVLLALQVGERADGGVGTGVTPAATGDADALGGFGRERPAGGAPSGTDGPEGPPERDATATDAERDTTEDETGGAGDADDRA